MEYLKLVYPVISRVARNYRRFVQRFQRLGINGYFGNMGYRANNKTHEQDNKTNDPKHELINNHYIIYPIYPLIIHVIEFIEVFENNLWMDYWRELIETQATQGAANGR